MSYKPRIIIKAIEDRKEYINYLKKHLPNAEFCMDEKRDAFDTFLRSLELAGNDAVIHMEEDVILTKNFYEKACKVIEQKPLNIIQFFSMRKKDLEIGSRWDNNFLMNQCTYYPFEYSAHLLRYWHYWSKLPQKLEKHPNGTDQMVCDFIKHLKIKYWIHIPNLVDHRVGKSVIDPRRASTNRQSFTFKDGVL